MAQKGAAAFDAHYRQAYGSRWDGLRKALLEEKRHAVVFGQVPPEGIPGQALPWFPGAFALDGRTEFPNARCYFMDAASLLPVLALDPQPGERVLDMCAAPGGKSLLIAWALGASGELTANDRSPERRGRLKKTLEELTVAGARPQIQVTGHAAERWGLHHPNSYDKILLDAPCSSERHVLEDPKELENWSYKRPTRLSGEQFALLCSALDSAKPGATIVYSTCALEPRENDGVVAKLLERRVGKVEVSAWESPLGGRTVHGWRVLPDRDGWGPFYLSCLRKL